MKINLLLIGAILVLVSKVHCQDKSELQIDSLIAAPNYEEALKRISSRLESKHSNENAILQNKKAEVLVLLGKLDEAEIQLNGITISANPFIEGITATNKGFLFLNKARNDLAIENLKAALDNFKLAKKSDSKEAALCLAHLSFAYLSIGKLNQSLENGLLALQLRQQLFGEQNEMVAASYNDLGVVYSQIDPDKALDYYDKALVIYQELHGDEHPKIAIASTNTGIIYQQLKLYGDAINNFETAKKIWEKTYPNGHPNQALALFNLGKTYNLMGDTKAAITFFEKAIALYKQTLGEKHPSLSTVYNQLGLVYMDLNKYDRALACAQAAFCANLPLFNNFNMLINPPVKEFYNANVFLYSLQLKADALEAKYYGKSLKFEDLKLALNTLIKADSLLDFIRHTSDNENDKIAVGAIATDVFENAVNLSVSMSEMTLFAKKYREIAFYFVEKSKSAVLQESIADADAKSFAGIPNSLLEFERTLKSSLTLVNQKLSQKPTLEEEHKLRQNLFALNQQFENFTKNLEKEYPEYFKLKFENKISTIQDIQLNLADKTALVSYFVAEKNKKIYRFVITKNSFDIKVSTLPENFNRYISGFGNSIIFKEAEIYQTTSSILSKALVTNLPKQVKNILIIPTGKLSTIPFEALLYKKTTQQHFEDKPFIIKKYGISYEFSAGLYMQKSKAVQATKSPSIFLCAPVRFSEEQDLDELPGTEQEVNSIASLFKKEKTMLVTYANASEERIKDNQLKDFSYLHFATHGIVDEVSPELSRIFLSNSKTDDGNLFSGEIYNLRLPAELAVLSACQTGLGKVSKGEGVIGLSRALTYSGVKNIVVSLWRVNDLSTSVLMADFYNHLLSQSSTYFSTALRMAKLAMIKNKKYSLPYYWAPFVLIGQ